MGEKKFINIFKILLFFRRKSPYLLCKLPFGGCLNGAHHCLTLGYAIPESALKKVQCFSKKFNFESVRHFPTSANYIFYFSNYIFLQKWRFMPFSNPPPHTLPFLLPPLPHPYCTFSWAVHLVSCPHHELPNLSFFFNSEIIALPPSVCLL